jgi:hypothetical protein
METHKENWFFGNDGLGFAIVLELLLIAVTIFVAISARVVLP